jgi:ubiquinone/menaquinone biosynthesis C-methylase UbiE
VRTKIKSLLIPIVGKSRRLRWDLAGLTNRRAFESVCATSDEKSVDSLGMTDAQRIVPLLDKSSLVLDIGCGVGRVEKFLWPHCRLIHSVDVSDRMISVARKRLEGITNISFFRMSATDLRTFNDESYDLCFSFHCLQHMEKEDAFLSLRQIFRVLKPNGIGYLHFPDFGAETYFSLFKRQSNWNDRSRVRAYTMPELRTILGGLGFKITREEHVCLNPNVQPIEEGRDILLTLRK